MDSQGADQPIGHAPDIREEGPARAGLATRLAGALAALQCVYLRAPLLLALVAAALLFALNPQLSTALAGGVLAAAGFMTGLSLTRHHAAALAAQKRMARAEVDRVVGLCANSAPVWVRQIETVRNQADAQIGELAQVFGQITGKLDTVMGPARLGDGTGGFAEEEILEALARNGRDLGRLVDALAQLQAGKQRIVDEIGLEAMRLKDNASDIRQIALHIRMVSLNATIEAARAGAAGKPFGVIVADMRQLAVRTAEASELFSRHTDRLHGMVASALKDEEQAGGGINSIAGAEALVHQVVAGSETMMRRLTRAIAAMEEERKDVREDISRVLVALQFQDRVSQILSHVSRNLEEMRARIEAGQWSAMDERRWLERLAAEYSTHEEFGNHDPSRLTAQPSGSAVTFF
jgi:methyl-accepting chemotaxis protein